MDMENCVFTYDDALLNTYTRKYKICYIDFVLRKHCS